MTYELLAYLSVRATQIGMKACEIPVARVYPKTGKTPTKISFFKGNSELMKILLKNACGAYNPKQIVKAIDRIVGVRIYSFWDIMWVF